MQIQQFMYESHNKHTCCVHTCIYNKKYFCLHWKKKFGESHLYYIYITKYICESFCVHFWIFKLHKIPTSQMIVLMKFSSARCFTWKTKPGSDSRDPTVDQSYWFRFTDWDVVINGIDSQLRPLLLHWPYSQQQDLRCWKVQLWKPNRWEQTQCFHHRCKVMWNTCWDTKVSW